MNNKYIRQNHALSRCRQNLLGLQKERTKLEVFLLGSKHMVEGSIVKVRRVCGKSNCRCATSKRYWHGPYIFLSLSREGKTRMIHIPKIMEEIVCKGVEDAKLYRKAYKRWQEIQRSVRDLWKQVYKYRKYVPYEPKKKSR